MQSQNEVDVGSLTRCLDCEVEEEYYLRQESVRNDKTRRATVRFDLIPRPSRRRLPAVDAHGLNRDSAILEGSAKAVPRDVSGGQHDIGVVVSSIQQSQRCMMPGKEYGVMISDTPYPGND